MSKRSIRKREIIPLLSSINTESATSTNVVVSPLSSTKNNEHLNDIGSRGVSISTDTNSTATLEITCETAEEKCHAMLGTESKFSATLNLTKCICGAGSFALPHVFLNEGVIGGSIALITCGLLATYTMQLLLDMKIETNTRSYVELAEQTLGPKAANIVFALTLSASLGVCSSYLVFMGETLESLSCDVTSSNPIRFFFPDVYTITWEIILSAILFPLILLRSYAVFAFTSSLGVLAVLGGILVTLLSGMYKKPGGGFLYSVQAVTEQKLGPSSFAAFGSSFGTVAFLFCINFVTFPIMNSMKEPREYKDAIRYAVLGTASFNIFFAVLCVGFYGEETADLVLKNLENDSYSSALKILLCVDLMFTFPLVFSSGRQIIENGLLGDHDGNMTVSNIVMKRATISAAGVVTCLSLAQIGGFGTIANFVGGFAQGSLAFVLPPLIAIVIARKNLSSKNSKLGSNNDELEFCLNDRGGEIPQVILGLFGVFVVLSTSYSTAISLFQ